jgi:hypothetical protein
MRNVTKIILNLLLLPLFACSTVEKTSDVGFVSQQNFVGRTRVDSVMLRDSIFIREKSDTVFYTKYRTLYKERLRVDTIVRCDTLYRDREVVVERIRDEGCRSPFYRKLLPVALVLASIVLWRTGLWRVLLNVIMKAVELCKRVFRLKG